MFFYPLFVLTNPEGIVPIQNYLTIHLDPTCAVVFVRSGWIFLSSAGTFYIKTGI